MADKNGNKTGGRKKGVKNRTKGNNTDLFLTEFAGTLKTGKSYVYYHVDNTSGDIFYIGKGTELRAYHTAESSRNKKWWDYVNHINFDYSVKIVAVGLSRNEALSIEKVLIQLRYPFCNIKHFDDINTYSQQTLFKAS